MRTLDCALGQGMLLRGLFRGERLVYAFVADPALRVMTTKELPEDMPHGVLYCFGIEEGLFVDGRAVERPEQVFALRADGSAAAIELTAAERDELARHLRLSRERPTNEELLVKLRSGLSRDAGEDE